jgi:hypothetical protein
MDVKALCVYSVLWKPPNHNDSSFSYVLPVIHLVDHPFLSS